MSRLTNFVRGVFSGYVQLAANILFTLASVPLALHYLSKAEFALWALVTQIVSYFGLIDLGMSVSVGRGLADYKDDRDGGRYGCVLKSGALVFMAQGAVIVAVTLLLAGPLATAFGIDAAFRPEFIFLLRGHGLIMGFIFATKIFGAPIWGFQRYDVTNYAATTGFALQFAAVWACFRAGWGVKSMLAGYVATAALNAVWAFAAGLRLGFYPRRGGWGQIDRPMLYEMFRFGRDIFLMSLGTQLLSASQIMIVTRLLGLDAAATWAICSKLFLLAQQFVGRIMESSTGALTEMIVRGEQHRFKLRFRELTTLTLSASVAAGVVSAAVNPSFVQIWARGRVAWPSLLDILFGVLLVVTFLSRCLAGIVGITKKLRFLRFIYFFEGVMFCTMAWFGGSVLGFAGIAGAAVASTAICSVSYGFIRVRSEWHFSTKELLSWMCPAGLLCLILVPIAVILRWWVASEPSRVQFFLISGLLSVLALIFAWLVGVPASLKREIRERAAARARRREPSAL